MSQTGTHDTRVQGNCRTTWDEIHAMTFGAGWSLRRTIRLWRNLARRGIAPRPGMYPMDSPRSQAYFDPTRVIFGDLSGIPTLEKTEIQRLELRMRAGWIAEMLLPDSAETRDLLWTLKMDGCMAKDRLVTGTLRYVVRRARRYFGPALLELQDLIQEGVLGLIKAVEHYDPNRGPFLVCVRQWVDRDIRRALQDRGRIIRLPAGVQNELGRLKRHRSEFFVKHRRGPDPDELAESLGLTVKEVHKLLELLGDAKTGRDISAGPCHEDPPEVRAITRDRLERMRRALPSLDARTRRAIRLKFGLDGESLGYREIGERLGISREGARQMVLRGLRRLKEILPE